MKISPARPERKYRRKIHYINPRFQGGAALVVSAMVVAGGVLFGVLVYRDVGDALREAAMRGHFIMETPYEIVRDALLWHLAGLSATVSCLAVIVFLLLVKAVRIGVGRAIEAFGASEKGDLSTPTDARGLKEFRRFGELVDLTRTNALLRIAALREEAASLAACGLPAEAFRPRWEELKRKIREVAP
ncbi:MAG: hypothetical protein M1377_07405 [Deltaproteobacteria bacterium]|nr:hypothetical protein [Deltaproteobacteria bacterium]